MTNTSSAEEPQEKKQKTDNGSLEKEQRWLLEKTGLSSVNDLTALTKLNLPNCSLSSLPENLPELVPNLSILFAPKNKFKELPAVIGLCSKLQVGLSFVCFLLVITVYETN